MYLVTGRISALITKPHSENGKNMMLLLRWEGYESVLYEFPAKMVH